MMVVWFSSGALLLVMLTGASYSYPVKQGFDPSSREPSYPQPSVQKQPAAAPAAASYSSNSFAVPVGYDSSSSAGSKHPSSFQPTSTQDIPWAVAPPSPFSGEESARQFFSSKPAPEPLGPSNVSPPRPFPPAFQAGELSQMEESYEHGNYESETEEQGFQPPPLGFQPPPPPGVQALAGQEFTSKLQPSGLGGSWVAYPYPYPYDYMFLTGQYPPGTLTHSSSNFEQGTDHWQDIHYIRDYFPTNPSIPQVKTFPADFETPQSVKQPSQPVKQSIGSTSYGQSGAATGQNQPYGAVGLQGSYFQPGRF